MSQVDLKKTIKESRSEIEQYLKFLIDTQKKLESNLKKTEKDFKGSFDSQKSHLVSLLTSIVRDLESLVEKFNSDKNHIFKKDIDDFKKELSQILTNTKSDTEGSLTNIESIIAKLENDTSSLLRSQSKTILMDVSDVYKGEQDSIDFLSDTLTNSVDRLRASYENSVEQEIENLKSSTQLLYDNIIDGLDKFRNETSRITKIGEDKVEGTLEEAVQEIQSGFEGSSGSLRDVMRSIETKVQKVFADRTEEFTEILKNISNNFSNTIEEEKTNTYNIYEKGNEVLNAYKEKELESISLILEDAKTNFIKNMNINNEKLEKDTGTITENFKKSFQNSLNTASKSFESFYVTLNSWVDNIETTISSAKEELNKQKEKLVDQPIKNIQFLGEKMESQLSDYLSELQQTYQTDKEKIQTNFDSKLGKYQQDYTKHLDNLSNEMLNLIKGSINDQKSAFDNTKEDLNNHLGKILDDSEETFNKAYQGITGDFSQFTENQGQWQRSTSDDISRRLNEGKSRVVMDLESIVPQIVTLADSFRGNYQEVIKRAMTAMDSAVQLFKREDADESSKAHSIIDTQMRDIEKRINNRKQQSTDSINQLFTQLDSNQKDAVSKMKDDIRTKFTNSNTRYVDADERIGTQTQGILARHYETSNTFVEISQDKIQDLTKTSSLFQDKFTEIQVKVNEDLSLAVKNITTQVQNVTDKCDKIIESSNDYLRTLSSNPKQKIP
jgi:DNA-binding ferritin-like protein (Dps family)